jgi:N-[(2S)-2-amino-2-carboxyethyl]-L-glutamate dehydrogenase
LRNDDMLILKAGDVHSLLANNESVLIETVKAAYEAHSNGHSSLPHSTFLQFPNQDSNRIIALPGYLGEDFEIAGVKWISSFPANLEMGLNRASAVIILNSLLTGRPETLIEGSIISAKRTAASATLASQWIHNRSQVSPLGVIGCGLINFETVRFHLAAFPEIKRILIYDINETLANRFRKKCLDTFSEIEIEIAKDLRTILRTSSLLSVATTAIKPHLFDLSDCLPGSTILHISLRDLSPQIILSCDNVVDDIDHVCRAQTSIHLAEQLTGNRDFIYCTLADITKRNVPARKSVENITIFSPFGLGVLDLAVANFVVELARKNQTGTIIQSFLPGSWIEEK